VATRYRLNKDGDLYFVCRDRSVSNLDDHAAALSAALCNLSGSSSRSPASVVRLDGAFSVMSELQQTIPEDSTVELQGKVATKHRHDVSGHSGPAIVSTLILHFLISFC
jgi:hypothetical protein